MLHVVLLTGPPASGKSTIAGRVLGTPGVSVAPRLHIRSMFARWVFIGDLSLPRLYRFPLAHSKADMLADKVSPFDLEPVLLDDPMAQHDVLTALHEDVRVLVFDSADQAALDVLARLQALLPNVFDMHHFGLQRLPPEDAAKKHDDVCEYIARLV